MDPAVHFDRVSKRFVLGSHRAYLRYLYVSGEMAAATLNTLHNLFFYLDTMRRMRKAIEFNSFEPFRREFLDAYSRRPPADQ